MEINSTNIRELIELLEDYLSYVDEKDEISKEGEIEEGVEEEGVEEEGKAKAEAFLEAVNETLSKRSNDDDNFDKAIDKIAKGE